MLSSELELKILFKLIIVKKIIIVQRYDRDEIW